VDRRGVGQVQGDAVIDRRKYAAQGHGPGQRWRTSARSWSKVTGLCLHQTACVLGERVERWDSVGSHVGITRAGQEFWLHDFDRIVAHGNGWNARTVGIEIDGLYAGVEGDPATVWDDPSTPGRERGMVLPAIQVTAACDAIRWIVGEVASHGGKVKALVSHRQASDSRRNDPGSAIWQAVALPMSDELGLSDGGEGFKIGDGRAIPKEWDGARRSRY
jgi:hypothetical protein